MSLQLTAAELRVIGSLIEKELTTPDYYPLTLSALVNACNQKTSRDPITSLSEAEVSEVIEKLVHDGLVGLRNPAGSRVTKYAHRLGDRLGLRFGFDRDQLAVLAVLMLRGPQTAAELRARSERSRGADQGPGRSRDIEDVLTSLANHERGAWVRELTREPGRRESRWTHLMGDPVAAPATADPPSTLAAPGPRDEATTLADPWERLERLERTLDELTATFETLEQRLAALERPPPP